MVLAQGTRLGPYQITAPIGAGGMGEVYSAVDTNLSRDVAIKVLPESVAADADRLARFDREARTLAALNHPNIAAIYGVERSGGRPYPALDRREQVAGENSRAPVWRGRELFYVESSATDASERVRIVAVPVTTTPTFSLGQPRVLFEGAFRIDGPFRGYDVTPDGQRFLMVKAVEQPPARIGEMVLVQNWVEELKARVPVR